MPTIEEVFADLVKLRAREKLEKEFTTKYYNITLTYNGITLRWNKQRNFDDFHGILTIGEGIDNWLDIDGVPHDFTHVDVLAIAKLIKDRRQELFMAKTLDEIDMANGIYTLSNISSI